MGTYDKQKIHKYFDKAYEQKLKKINEQLQQDVILSLIGHTTNTKKQTAQQLINDNIQTEGTYTNQANKTYKYDEHIIFKDTPTLTSKNKTKLIQHFKRSDLILFLLEATNAKLAKDELETFNQIKQMDKNIIFVLCEIEKVNNLAHIINEVRDVIGQAYNIIPISNSRNEGLERLRLEILKNLEKIHKDIQFARFIQNEENKQAIAHRWITSKASSTALIGVSLDPNHDITPLISILSGLLIRLALLYHKQITKENIKQLITSTLTKNLGESIFKKITKLIPNAGSLLGSDILGGKALSLGYTVNYMYQNDLSLTNNNIYSLYKSLK